MLLKYVWRTLTEPKQAWTEIREEQWSLGALFGAVLIPLALISPICGLIGTTQFGWQIGVGQAVKLTFNSALLISVAYFAAIVMTVYVISVLIHWMSETYGNKISISQAACIAVYAAVPLFFAGLLQLYPVLWVNFILGLPALAFSIYLLYLGVPIMMDIPTERGFVFATAILAVGLVSLVGLLASTVVLWSFGLGPAFTG